MSWWSINLLRVKGLQDIFHFKITYLSIKQFMHLQNETHY
jgi:hypothetical protein